jgi:hypothetical protein
LADSNAELAKLRAELAGVKQQLSTQTEEKDGLLKQQVEEVAHKMRLQKELEAAQAEKQAQL